MTNQNQSGQQNQSPGRKPGKQQGGQNPGQQSQATGALAGVNRGSASGRTVGHIRRGNAVLFCSAFVDGLNDGSTLTTVFHRQLCWQIVVISDHGHVVQN